MHSSQLLLPQTTAGTLLLKMTVLPYYLSSRFHCQNTTSHSFVPSCAINIRTAAFSTHVVNRRFLATEARFRYQDSLRGIYSDQNEIGTGFILAVRFIIVRYHSTFFHILSYVILGMDNRPIKGYSSRHIVSPHPKY